MNLKNVSMVLLRIYFHKTESFKKFTAFKKRV